MKSIANSDAIDALVERAQKIQWLQPDSEIDRKTPDSLTFIHDRVDEHVASLEKFSHDGPLPVKPSIVHSMYDSWFSSGQFFVYPGKVHFSPPALRWQQHLDYARSEVLGYAQELDPSLVANMANKLWAVFRQTTEKRPLVQRTLTPSQQRLYDRMLAAKEFVSPVPGGESWLLEALRLATDAPFASPWTPLFSLWERGIATLPNFDGKMLLYIPVRAEGAVIPEPDPGAPFSPFDEDAPSKASAEERRKRREMTGRFHGGTRLSTYDRDPSRNTPGSRLSWWAIIKRFARSGLGPLPGMTDDKIDITRDLAVSNSPYVRPSLWITPLPENDWTAKDAAQWLGSADDNHTLMRRSTFPDV